MRTRTWFAGLAAGAALLAGGPIAAAQAAPAPSQTSTTSAVAANTAAVPRTYTDVGTYPTKKTCEADGRASVYSDWYCQKSSTTTNYHLWVNLNS
ncbi:hypothetical protein [Streptomyces sp. NPDC046925]|uniref:hypothetical protein n=1 Tax=Streptomyces sp. NPDC046925 TaxID=3155375 RepID=UPI0033E2BA89